MANQTITTSTNHDILTGRSAGEDITIQTGAVLTINSMPQHTPMGILGDILLTSGEVHIDGRYVREIAYSSGSGTIPTVTTGVTWNSAAGTGKVIKLNSGDNVSGVMTITVISGTNPSGTITDGAWSATVDSDKVGYLMVFGEDQVWDATDATCTMRITGDWYELGVGDGSNYQSFILPHKGWQHAIWVETGSGTTVYEIWHRVLQNGVNYAATSTVFWDNVTDWGNSFETGFVFYNDRTTGTTGTVVVGTSSNGGVIPLGAKVRIPNVHIGTTTLGSPFIEYSGVTVGSCLEILDSLVTENVFIDHLNASTSQASLVQTNGGTISDSCLGWINATNVINRCNTAVSITNCAYVLGTGLAGDTNAAGFIIQDNVGGITMEDCVIYAGINGSNSRCFNLVTMANIILKGKNKFPANQQDENSYYAIGGSVASNVIFSGDTIFNSAGIATLAGCVNWEIENIIWSQNTVRGSAEDSMVLGNFTGTDTLTIQGGRFATGSGVRHMNGGLFILTDCANTHIRNFGEVDAKINCGGRGTYVVSCAGITNNCTFKRLYFTNRNTVLPFTQLNSDTNLIFENCSCDYNDELESMSNNTLMKGIHGASGNIGTTTGWEDNYPNVVGSIFYDCFKSDTTGGIGLLFNPPGNEYLNDVSLDSGTTMFNGIGDLLMTAVDDQITYTFPYSILGHTGFTATLPHLLGVNCGTLGAGWGNFIIEYSINTGSTYGDFKTGSTENLTAETISGEGFGLKIRIKCVTASTTNRIRGLQIHTSTTIANQKANLYPLNTVPVRIEVLDAEDNTPITGATVYLETTPGGVVIINSTTDANGLFTMDYGLNGVSQAVDGRVRKATVYPYYKEGTIIGPITSAGLNVTVLLIKDE